MCRADQRREWWDLINPSRVGELLLAITRPPSIVRINQHSPDRQTERSETLLFVLLSLGMSSDAPNADTAAPSIVKPVVRYESYSNEDQIAVIQDLIREDLSEPYTM